MCTIPWAFGAELGRAWTYNGLVLIVVACPCALIISTPVTYVAGLAVVDLNFDGLMDIVVSGDDFDDYTTRIFTNQGDLSFVMSVE